MFQLWKISAAVAVIAMVGCSDPGPLRFPVEGMLTLDGEPVPFKSLTLVPTEGTPGHGAAGYSDGEGKFRLQAIVPGAIRDYQGCPPGKYQVVVGEPLIPLSGSLSPDQIQGEVVGDEGPAAAVAMVQPTRRRAQKGDVPLHYTSDRTSPLTVEVAEGIASYELAMQSKRGSVASASSSQRRD